MYNGNKTTNISAVDDTHTLRNLLLHLDCEQKTKP